MPAPTSRAMSRGCCAGSPSRARRCSFEALCGSSCSNPEIPGDKVCLRVGRGLLRLDVGLVNDAAIFVILSAQEECEIGPTHPDRGEALRDELCLDLRCLH